MAKNTTKVWNSSEVFFSCIIYYKRLIVFLWGISRSLNFIFSIIYLNKHTNDCDDSHITAILQWNINISNILFIMLWTDIARFLHFFRNISNSFINILAILQHFNRIFSKYSFNITVLCGLFQKGKWLRLPYTFSHWLRYKTLHALIALYEILRDFQWQFSLFWIVKFIVNTLSFYLIIIGSLPE